MDLIGDGDIDFNQTNSTVFLPAVGGGTGKIRLNGTGGAVHMIGNEGFFDLEMNSPGGELIFNPTANLDATTETLTFNQPGTARHLATANRIQGAQQFYVNAPVTVDLTTEFGSLERRWLTSGRLEGNSNLTVNGTPTEPLNVDYNEFEIGSQGTTENEPASLITSNFGGTVTLNDYVNMEVRQNLPNGTIVVGNHALLEMGHMKRAAANSVRIGQIEVLNGGTLEVGMEKSDATVDGHFAYHLTLDDEGGKTGGLVMQNGSQLNMQINGTALTDFDRITADGDVTVNGTLRIFVNPASCIGNTTCSTAPADANPTFDPATHVGTSWDIITTVPGDSPPGDYDGDGTVDDADYDEWVENFGGTGSADGNGDGTVNAADHVVWKKFFGATGTGGSEIDGTFDFVVDDLAGYHFNVTYLSNIVRLTLATGDSGASGGVPEPSTLALVGLMFSWLSASGRTRRGRV
jgi:hypothetical protein